MIGRLRGIILEKQPPQMLLETHGIGYEIQLPMTCFYNLPEIGQEVIIFTYFIVREATQLLFGFIHKQERMLFCELIKVDGVGPKLALAILSEMPVQQLLNIIQDQRINMLVKLPGVGKKIAQRLIVEMKDKFKDLSKELFLPHEKNNFFYTFDTKTGSTDPRTEAISALIALGYKPQEASQMIAKVANINSNSEMLIRDALRASL